MHVLFALDPDATKGLAFFLILLAILKALNAQASQQGEQRRNRSPSSLRSPGQQAPPEEQPPIEKKKPAGIVCWVSAKPAPLGYASVVKTPDGSEFLFLLALSAAEAQTARGKMDQLWEYPSGAVAERHSDINEARRATKRFVFEYGT